MSVAPNLIVGIAGESLSNRETTKLATGLFRCADLASGGWEDLGARLPEAPEVRVLCAHPTAPGTLFAGTQYGVHRSDDAGASWQILDLPQPHYGVWSLAFHPQDPDIMIAGYEPGAVFRSEDGGHSWHEAQLRSVYPVGSESEPKRVMGLVFDDVEPQFAYGALEVGGLVRSCDGGRSWDSVDVCGDVDRADVHAIAARGGRVVAACRIGVLVSEDRGQSWSHRAGDFVDVVGLGAQEIESLVQRVSRERFDDNLMVHRLDEGAGRVRVELRVRWPGRDDYGGHFDARGIGGRPGAEGRVNAAACWHAFAAVIDGLLSAAPGVRVTTSLTSFDSPADFCSVAAADLKAQCRCNTAQGAPNAETLLRVRRWMWVDQYCRCVVIATDDPDTLFIGAGAGYLAESGALWCSHDGGDSWAPLNLPAEVNSALFGLTSDPHDPTRLYAACKDGLVLESGDRGLTWRCFPLPSGADPVYALAVTRPPPQGGT